ncbi:MAG TPA: hypothetical protein PKD00_03340 [Burkholderiales bacterium]|nr:hypothetical protein [Burkholderiales bacterium]
MYNKIQDRLRVLTSFTLTFSNLFDEIRSSDILSADDKFSVFLISEKENIFIYHNEESDEFAIIYGEDNLKKLSEVKTEQEALQYLTMCNNIKEVKEHILNHLEYGISVTKQINFLLN